MCIGHSLLPIIMTAKRETRVNLNRLSSALLLVLTACAAAPGPTVHDNLDPKTGTTVSVASDTVELLTDRYVGVRADTFAYLAPFEVDRMGTRTLFLWVLVPKDSSASAPPVIQCDGKIVTLPVQSGPLADIGLADAPYSPADPWGAQWYFALDKEVLECLAQAHLIALEIPGPRDEVLRFVAEGAKGTQGFAVLKTFAARRAD
jgi:hypothetical protein